MSQQIDRAAVERGRRDDVIAGTEEGGDGEMHRGHAARGAHRADARFERREALLQHRDRRVRDARVDVSRPLQVEQGGRMIRILEHERGGLVDRRGTRTGHGIRMLAGMQAQRFERRRFGCGHAFPREELADVERGVMLGNFAIISRALASVLLAFFRPRLARRMANVENPHSIS